MFNSILGFSDQAFSVLLLCIISIVTTYIWHGASTQKSKESFVALLLILIIGAQIYHLIYAAISVPADQFFVFDV